MKRLYEVIKREEIKNLSKAEIKDQFNFCGSLAGADQLFFGIDNKLYLTRKNGLVEVYNNVHGSWGFCTYLN